MEDGEERVVTDVKTMMTEGAARLLAERGLQRTSFSEVVALTGAPRGSIYHHFPQGKAELIAGAIASAGDRAVALLEPTRGESAVVVAERFLAVWRFVLESSEFRMGCSVTAVVVASEGESVTTAAEVFVRWEEHLAGLLATGGVPRESADAAAALLIAATEGAVVLSRAARAIEPFERVAGELLSYIRSLSRSPGR